MYQHTFIIGIEILNQRSRGDELYEIHVTRKRGTLFDAIRSVLAILSLTSPIVSRAFLRIINKGVQ